MATIRELRLKARKLGITNARELDLDELKEAIADAKNGSSTKSKSKKAVKAVKTKKRGPGRPKKIKDEDEDDEPKRGRGRPKGSGKKKVVEEAPKKRGRPAKEKTGSTKAKKKSNGVGRPVGSGTGTRVLVPERIKWNKKFDFREGSQAQYILEALRKAAEKYDDTSDIREAAIERLEKKLGDIDELTFMNRATGKPHKGEAAEKMLRYRVNVTILTFCQETGQHEGADAPAKKKASKSSTTVTKKRGRPKKVVDEDDEDEDDEDLEDDDEDEEDEPVKKRRGRPPGSGKKTGKRGRPKGSKNKSSDDEPKKRGRPKGSGTKKRGRPKGSKNK